VTLTTQLSDEARGAALLQALGFDRLNEGQRELALGIARRYNLDPMLRHLVMIEGKPYITRDGLLHVAHASQQLDGIEVTEPTLADGFWRATCSVYRKDMSRAFTYTGRYPEQGKNKTFAPEMATKVAEVMALRRAFDVAAPVMEERWDVDQAEAVASPQGNEPTSLAERVAQKAETIAPPAQERTETIESKPDDIDVGNLTSTPVLQPVEAVESPPDPMTLKAFAESIEGVDRVRVKRVAKQLFPDVTKFGDLSSDQLALLAETLRDTDDADPTSPPETTTATSGSPSTATTPEDTSTGADPDPTPTSGSSDDRCGDISPLSGATCTLDPGHPGRVHRNGLRESWEAQ
jgi:hypothetical protein